MARDYGRLATSIWRDDDFRTLDPIDKLVYISLITRSDITAAGTLPLMPSRWAKALGMEAGAVSESVGVLAAHEQRYVVPDWDTEELLVRSFIKWDGGANNAKRREAILSAAKAVESRRIAHALALEMARNGLCDTPSDTPSDTHRVVVKKGDQNSNPQPATHNPDPQPATLEGEPQPIDADSVEPPRYCSKHPNGTDDNCGPCKTARLKWEAWRDNAPIRVRRQRLADATRRANCPDCHGTGWTEDADGNPSEKCNHRRRA